MKAGFLLCLLSQTLSANAASGSLFNVTYQNNSLAITSTVTNHVYSFAGIKVNTAGFSLAGGCQNTSNGYCLFTASNKQAANIAVTGSGSQLSLTLCLDGRSRLSCQNYSVSTGSANTTPRFAYAGNFSGLPAIVVCNMNPDGSIIQSSCTDAGGGSVLPGGVSGIAIRNNIAYITNSQSVPNVYTCAVTANGLFTSCLANTISTPSNYLAIYGWIALSPDNQTAYIPDTNLSGQVLSCPVSNGTVGPNCTVEAATIGLGSFSAGITMNAAGNIVYIATGSSNVLVCDINNGVFSNCTTKTGDGTNNFSYTGGVALNNTGSILYVTDNVEGNVFACSPTTVNPSSHLFSSCFVATVIPSAYGITLNAANTMAYVTDFGSNIYACPIQNDGSFGTCTPYTNAALQSTTGITLGY